MTRETYIHMTETTRNVLSRLPGGAALLRMPTYVCAAVYMLALLHLMVTHDLRLFRALLVPAVCFITCTVLRPLINRERPYDRFTAPPVGNYRPGKGKSQRNACLRALGDSGGQSAAVFRQQGENNGYQ